MNKFFSTKIKKRQLTKKTHLIGIVSLVSILVAFLLFLNSLQQKDLVHKTYCGEFGFYGKSLVLMKDGTFRFNYYGCSQLNGHVQGKWNKTGETLLFVPDRKDENLDVAYEYEETGLVPVNFPHNEGFVLCENFTNPWSDRPVE